MLVMCTNDGTVCESQKGQVVRHGVYPCGYGSYARHNRGPFETEGGDPARLCPTRTIEHGGQQAMQVNRGVCVPSADATCEALPQLALACAHT